MQQTAPPTALSVHDLSVTIGGASILRDVSFVVGAGEYVSIIGPNGAGKTTLLRCLTRYFRGYTGEVALFGCSTRRLSQRSIAQRAAYVPQAEAGTIPFSVEAFVAMGRYPYGGPFVTPHAEDRRAVDEALRAMGIEHLRQRHVATLSGGERRKVLLAAAVAQATPLLLLDEPTTFLDYRHRHEIQDLLCLLNRQRGTTIVSVTHDLNAAVVASHRVLALRRGELVFEGMPQELMQAETLQAIYDTPLVLVPHPTSGTPLVVPPVPGGDA